MTPENATRAASMLLAGRRGGTPRLRCEKFYGPAGQHVVVAL